MLEKSIKIVPINPPESSSFDVFVKVGIRDIAGIHTVAHLEHFLCTRKAYHT